MSHTLYTSASCRYTQPSAARIICPHASGLLCISCVRSSFAILCLTAQHTGQNTSSPNFRGCKRMSRTGTHSCFVSLPAVMSLLASYLQHNSYLQPLCLTSSVCLCVSASVCVPVCVCSDEKSEAQFVLHLEGMASLTKVPWRDDSRVLSDRAARHLQTATWQ